MNIIFPGLDIELDRQVLVLSSAQPLHCLSSAIVGGGILDTRVILNRHVDKDYDERDPVSEMYAFARRRHIVPPFVGLMTAVPLEKARTATFADGDLGVATVITAGCRNATAVGASQPFMRSPGTINVILLLDANLTPAAMVNAVITATEAKTAVLGERRIKTSNGYPATGTSTDAVVVACTGHGNLLSYAGPATTAGWLIGRCVRQALQEALDVYAP